MLTKGQIGFLDEHTRGRGKWSLNLSTGLVDIEGDFDCSMRSYTGFGEIRFGRVTGNFYCYQNQLQDLDGCPRFVGGNFICSHNVLRTLVGAPEEVRGDFWCNSNHKLNSLLGAPEVIGGRFSSWLVSVPEGRWSLATLARMYSEAVGQKQSLIGTLASPEDLQRKIDLNPEKMAVELKSIIGLPEYQCLKWPERLKEEVDLLGNLDLVGL